MTNSILILMLTGFALVALMAVVVTLADRTGRGRRREIAADRRQAWERSVQPIAG